MNKYAQTAAFAANLWVQRAGTQYLAHVKHEPLARSSGLAKAVTTPMPSTAGCAKTAPSP